MFYDEQTLVIGLILGFCLAFLVSAISFRSKTTDSRFSLFILYPLQLVTYDEDFSKRQLEDLYCISAIARVGVYILGSTYEFKI